MTRFGDTFCRCCGAATAAPEEGPVAAVGDVLLIAIIRDGFGGDLYGGGCGIDCGEVCEGGDLIGDVLAAIRGGDRTGDEGDMSDNLLCSCCCCCCCLWITSETNPTDCS